MKRALVLGSQIRDLRSVENDARAMTAMLEGRGFAVDLRIRDRATRAGILEGYRTLIDQTGTDDAAVVYYTGHGGCGVVPDEKLICQCIVPIDVDDGTEADFRGITGWELSILQSRLTQKTRNVTVILDCCYAAHMIRGARTLALPHPIKGFAAHLDALRAEYGATFHPVDLVSNPDVVRLVACGQRESAFAYQNEAGEYHAALTAALLAVLAESHEDGSWAAIIGAIRARVRRYFPIQHPDVEGPAQRRLFSLIEDSDAESWRDLPAVSLGAPG
jgi:Caspase domain